MEYAVQLFLPVMGGLWLGSWLTQKYGLSPIWTVVLGVLGLAGGIVVMYRRSRLEQNLPHFTPKPRQKPKPSQSLQALDSLYKKMEEELPKENDQFEIDDDTPEK
jgi:hypothetical protein